MDKTHTFSGCLEYERSQQEIADGFLKQLYPNNTIYRPKWSDPAGKTLQEMDIDVVLTHIGPTGWPIEYKISEKFRKGMWPCDVYIELYSDFDKKKLGYGLQSQAQEYHIYYREGDNVSVRIVPVWGVKKICQELKWLYDSTLDDMSKNKENHCSFLYKGHELILRFDPTYGGGQMLWRGASAIIPLEIFEYIKCKIIQYDLVNGAWKPSPDYNIKF